METLHARHISKSYGGTQALKQVSLDLRCGEIHALCGENGAGKSTLIKILSGVETPDEGQVDWKGSKLPYGRVHAVEAAGIVAVHQEPVVFPHLNVTDNLFVGREFASGFGAWLNKRSMTRTADKILASLGESLPLNLPVGSLSLAQRQMVSIARALLQQCRILILDEPTASLSARESERMFERILALKEQGVGILYVSHRLEEVFQISDRITVLRDGCHITTSETKSMTQDQLIQAMVGRSITLPKASIATSASSDRPTPILELKSLGRKGAFEDISFKIHPGEILGLSGLVGAGRSEIARAIFGIDAYDQGSIHYKGNELPKQATIQDAMEAGMALVPEDRQHQGLVLPMSVQTNLHLPVLESFLSRFGWKRRTMQVASMDLIDKLGIKTASPFSPAHALSGGNQQKIVIGKWLHKTPTLLILDEPTRGVDVGAKSEMYRIIREIAAQGSAVLLISSELPEILSLSDRILVLCQGRLRGEATRETATQEGLLKWALPEEHRRIA